MARTRNNQPPQVGDRFGRWTVTGAAVWLPGPGQRRMHVPCRCDCGTERSVLMQNLRRLDRGNPSCGCWRRERTKTIAGETRWKDSHGLSKHPLYQLWKRIKQRCYNPAAHNYRWYGALGVTMWPGWVNDAGAFIAYIEAELGPRPSPGHSIDRIDPFGNYEPGKLRWATAAEQQRNTRRAMSRTVNLSS